MPTALKLMTDADATEARTVDVTAAGIHALEAEAGINAFDVRTDINVLEVGVVASALKVVTDVNAVKATANDVTVVRVNAAETKARAI